MNLLLLEDDTKLGIEIQAFLATEGFTCELRQDGLSFLRSAYSSRFSLFILDINVPGMNGLEVCKKIRILDASTPILMLTAYSNVQDKVEALNSGADDYLVKPFHLDELLARIRALLRRGSKNAVTAPKMYVIGDLKIDTRKMQVRRANKEINLTPKEYRLIELLAEAAGDVVSKQTIAEKVWDINFETGTNTIEVYISFLRSKIDKGFKTPLIHTRPGYGYYLKLPGDS